MPDPKAKTFTPAVIQRAMLDTIAHINTLLEEEGITEVFCRSLIARHLVS